MKSRAKAAKHITYKSSERHGTTPNVAATIHGVVRVRNDLLTWQQQNKDRTRRFQFKV